MEEILPARQANISQERRFPSQSSHGAQQFHRWSQQHHRLLRSEGISAELERGKRFGISAHGGGRLDSHTEWVEGRVHQTGFTAVFTPNTEAPHLFGGNAYDVDFTSAEEGESANPTYAAVTSRSYHPGAVQALYMDGSVHSLVDSIEWSLWRALSTRAGGEAVSAP